MSKENWTPYDTELITMIESLLGKPCLVMVGDEKGYLIECDYENHKDEHDFLSAVIAAIDGRVGDRFVEVNAIPQGHKFIVKIGHSKTEYPELLERVVDGKEDPKKGVVYCHKLEEVRALQVIRGNSEMLMDFVGNGTMVIERGLNGKAWFRFLNAGSVYADAPEYSYIVYVSPGRFAVISQKTFEEEYERKEIV